MGSTRTSLGEYSEGNKASSVEADALPTWLDDAPTPRLTAPDVGGLEGLCVLFIDQLVVALLQLGLVGQFFFRKILE